MVLGQFGAPFGELEAQLLEDLMAAVHLDGVALPVVEPDGFDVLIAVERPRKASGGVLPTGEKDQCFEIHDVIT
jgi:hypothetical protein